MRFEGINEWSKTVAVSTKSVFWRRYRQETQKETNKVISPIFIIIRIDSEKREELNWKNWAFVLGKRKHKREIKSIQRLSPTSQILFLKYFMFLKDDNYVWNDWHEKKWINKTWIEFMWLEIILKEVLKKKERIEEIITSRYFENWKKLKTSLMKWIKISNKNALTHKQSEKMWNLIEWGGLR